MPGLRQLVLLLRLLIEDHKRLAFETVHKLHFRDIFTASPLGFSFVVAEPRRSAYHGGGVEQGCAA